MNLQRQFALASLALLGAAFMATVAAGQGRLDVLVVEEGRSIRGTITKTTPANITVDVRGVEQTFDVKDVQRVVFAEEPVALRQARELVAQEQYEAALSDLARIDPGSLKRDILRQELQYLRAYCNAMGGPDVTDAAKEMLRFVRNHGNSHHYYDALEMVGNLVMQIGRYEKAAEFFADLGKAPWPERKLQAAVLEAMAIQAQGPSRYGEAVKRYDAVIQARYASAAADRLKQLARVGKAACQAELGDPAAAIKDVEQIIAKNDAQDVELFARAYNALGACYRKADKPKEATLAYLHTDILYYRERDAHAEALYHLSSLWRQVGKTDRAVQAQQLLKSRYANSAWAQKN